MSETRPLFRPEAVEAHARGRSFDDDEGLELREGQTAWTFRLLIIGLVLFVASAFVVRIEETARGQAVVTGNSAIVNLPVAALARVREGHTVTLGDARGTVADVLPPSSSKAGVAVVPVRVTFTSGRPAPGEATVLLARRTIVSLMLSRGGNG